MEYNTILTEDIQLSEGKAAYDAYCLRLLSNVEILSRIVGALVEEFKGIPVKDIAEKYLDTPRVREIPMFPGETNANRRISGIGNEDKSATEGERDFDILFNAVAPLFDKPIKLIINLEAQNNQHPGYPITTRAFYQGSRLISSQYSIEFSGSDFKNLKKVYSIWILPNPNKGEQNVIEKYSIVRELLCGSREEPVRNYDLMTVIMVYLGDPKQPSDSEIVRLLSVLLSHKLTADEKLTTLEKEFEIPVTYEIKEEVANMCNLSDALVQQGDVIGYKRGVEEKYDAQAKMVGQFMKMSNCSLEEVFAKFDFSDIEKNAIRLRLQPAN